MNMIDLHLILGGVIEYRSQKESILCLFRLSRYKKHLLSNADGYL